jgi:hypothetical protein
VENISSRGGKIELSVFFPETKEHCKLPPIDHHSEHGAPFFFPAYLA